MVGRRLRPTLERRLGQEAAVGLIGPRQVGKTTLALAVGEGRGALYLDLERRQNRLALEDPGPLLDANADRLVILDEVHHVPELFPELRGIVDEGRRRGKGRGRFLVLGSASVPLLRQSESLAGRIAWVELGPLDVLEIAGGDLRRLWVRGGLPRSFLASSDRHSFDMRQDFVRTTLARDVPLFVPRLPMETLHRLWTMLAHGQGTLLNLTQLAGSLGIGASSVRRYLDLLVDLLLVRRLPPWRVNVRKRLVKSPRIYLRDSGLLHALLGLPDLTALLLHPIAGPSWEGFVIENLLAVAPPLTGSGFYRTARGAEVDLVLQIPGRVAPWVVEIRSSSTPTLTRGFHSACRDLQPERAFVVHGGEHRFRLRPGVEAIPLPDLARLVAAANPAAGARPGPEPAPGEKVGSDQKE